MAEGNRFYKDGVVDPQMEMLRLADTFPTQVTVSLVTGEMAKIGNKAPSLLDLGSGPNSTLGEVVQAVGGEYVALDLMFPYLKKQTGTGNTSVQADMEFLPFCESSFDMIHTRGVLAFLAPGKRELILSEILAQTKQTAIFIEYNYENIREWEGVADEFGRALLTTLQKVGFDPYYGKRLDQDIRTNIEVSSKVAEVVVKEIQRPLGNHYQEMLIRATELINVARKFGDEESAATFQNVISQIDTDEKRENLSPFKTPDAKAVIVRFKN